MKRRLGAMLAALAMFASVGAASVAAVPAYGETMPGNYQCPAGSTKIDPVYSGTYSLADGGTITITVRSTSMGPVFDFTTSGAVIGSIVVKGGPNYHWYNFTPPREWANGLHSPLNAANGKWYGLSHLCIESEKKGDPDPKK